MSIEYDDEREVRFECLRLAHDDCGMGADESADGRIDRARAYLAFVTDYAKARAEIARQEELACEGETKRDAARDFVNPTTTITSPFRSNSQAAKGTPLCWVPVYEADDAIAVLQRAESFRERVSQR